MLEIALGQRLSFADATFDLLPIQGQPSASKGEYGLAVNTSALALSLLASFVQIPGFCQEPQLTSRIPLLCKVFLAAQRA